MKREARMEYYDKAGPPLVPHTTTLHTRVLNLHINKHYNKQLSSG